MKKKFFLAAMLCLALAVFAGCGRPETEDDSSPVNIYVHDSGAISSGNTADSSDSPEAEDADSTEESTENESEVSVMYITINSNKVQVQLAQNSSVDALVGILKQNDITYTADDYGNFEKVGNIGYSLPRNDEEITTQAGDVILYQGNSICLYYGVNTWSFTKIGKIDGTAAEIRQFLCAGGGSVTITLSLN